MFLTCLENVGLKNGIRENESEKAKEKKNKMGICCLFSKVWKLIISFKDILAMVRVRKI